MACAPPCSLLGAVASQLNGLNWRMQTCDTWHTQAPDSALSVRWAAGSVAKRTGARHCPAAAAVSCEHGIIHFEWTLVVHLPPQPHWLCLSVSPIHSCPVPLRPLIYCPLSWACHTCCSLVHGALPLFPGAQSSKSILHRRALRASVPAYGGINGRVALTVSPIASPTYRH